MAKDKSKTAIEALRADKWGLPIINGLIIVFLGFLVFGTFVGFDEAIGVYGLFAGTILALILSPLGKNTLTSYTNASLDFQLWVFVILLAIIVIFLTLVYPKKSK